MYLTHTIGPIQVEYEQRAIHITRQPRPNPNCLSCHGNGGHGWVVEGGYADWEDCHCVPFLRTWRLPLWPGAPRREAPF